MPFIHVPLFTLWRLFAFALSEVFFGFTRTTGQPGDSGACKRHKYQQQSLGRPLSGDGSDDSPGSGKSKEFDGLTWIFFPNQGLFRSRWHFILPSSSD